MSLTADTITDEQIRALRDRYGEGSRRWDPAVVHKCELALGNATASDDRDRDQQRHQARTRCAEILNSLGTAPRKAPR